MIKIVELPQRSDMKIKHTIDGDIITIIIDSVKEVFDFSGLSEGIAEEIIIEYLPLNPIISAVKKDDILTVEVLRFYSFEEKHLFEVM